MFIRRFAILFILAIAAIPKNAVANELVDITGFVSVDNRMTVEPGTESVFSYNETTLGIKLNAFPTNNLQILGSLEFDSIYVNERQEDDTVLEVEHQQDRTEVDPVRVEIDEAFIAATGLGLKDLDFRIGKQRIQWGTGDQFNPTDNLNPDDFHDPLLFGKKLAIPSVAIDYYAGPVKITAVAVPLFYPVLLPITDIRPIFELQYDKLASEFDIDTGDQTLDVIINGMMIPALQTAKLGTVEVESKLPDRSAKNMNAAIKVSGNAGPVDLSASYAYVRDDFGVPRKVTMFAEPFNAGTTLILDRVDLHVLQEFPRTQVIGADFSASIPKIDIGVWGEAGYFIPVPFKTEYFLDTGTKTNAILDALTDKSIPDGLIIAEDEPLKDHYIKATAGFDYTFPGAIYMNVQYVRGLPSDNTAELVDDYIFGGIDKPFYHDTIKPRIFSGVCIQDESWILFPEIAFLPMGSLELKLGALFVFGELDTKFGAFGDDVAFFRAKVDF